jgi:DNA transposition AAA+ family ATPase
MKNGSIYRALEQEARQIKERIPMSQTQLEAEALAMQLVGFLAANTMSQSAFAKKIGVSNSQISQFIGGKYKGDLAGLMNKIVNVINQQDRKQRVTKDRPVYIETTVARQVQTLIISAQSFSDDEGKIGLIIGDGGHGKSHCLRQYVLANKNSIYVELDDTMSATSMFAAIARQLSIDSTGALSAVTQRIIDTLRHRDMTVILDEASSLTVRQLNLLRQIIAVKSRCPLILAGNRDLMNRVMQPKTRRGCESLDQFTSRLMAILDLDEMAADKDGGGGLYTVDDIRKLYEYGGVRITKDGVKMLQQICRSERSGRLRTCSQVITALHTSVEVQEDQIINADRIVAVIMQLKLPVRIWLPISAREARRQAEEEPADVAAAG